MTLMQVGKTERMWNMFHLRLAAALGLCGLLALAPAAPASAKSTAEIGAGVKAAREQCTTQIEGCKAAAEKAVGMLVFPEVTKAAVGIGGSYGEGALVVGDQTQGYYSTTSASIGLQLGAQTASQIIMFMTQDALEKFRNSSGWEAGANAQVTMIDQGKAADIDEVLRSTPVVAFIFGQKGLMGDLSIEGAKITKLER
jgi:lipid-binding SYLF domain-containing protein